MKSFEEKKMHSFKILCNLHQDVNHNAAIKISRRCHNSNVSYTLSKKTCGLIIDKLYKSYETNLCRQTTF